MPSSIPISLLNRATEEKYTWEEVKTKLYNNTGRNSFFAYWFIFVEVIGSWEHATINEKIPGINNNGEPCWVKLETIQ